MMCYHIDTIGILGSSNGNQLHDRVDAHIADDDRICVVIITAKFERCIGNNRIQKNQTRMGHYILVFGCFN